MYLFYFNANYFSLNTNHNRPPSHTHRVATLPLLPSARRNWRVTRSISQGCMNSLLLLFIIRHCSGTLRHPSHLPSHSPSHSPWHSRPTLDSANLPLPRSVGDVLHSAMLYIISSYHLSGLWLVETRTLASDGLRGITWPGHWPLIGRWECYAEWSSQAIIRHI